MTNLARSRTIFHSEADFQHAFAWELQRLSPEWNIRIEIPVRSYKGAIHLDLLARSSSAEIAVELKYKTRRLSTAVSGELFSLADQAAQDTGRYDFFRDVCRVETFVRDQPSRLGYAIFLTNDSAYWKIPSRENCGYAEFAMSEGRVVSGALNWGSMASEGTRRAREAALVVQSEYTLRWKPFTEVSAKGYRDFRYLCVQAAAQ